MSRNLIYGSVLSIWLTPLQAQSAPTYKNYFPELGYSSAMQQFPDNYYDFCEKTESWQADGVPERKSLLRNTFDAQNRVVESEFYFADGDAPLKWERLLTFTYESPNSKALKGQEHRSIASHFHRIFIRDERGRIDHEVFFLGNGQEEKYHYRYNGSGKLFLISNAQGQQVRRFTPGLPAEGLVTIDHEITDQYKEEQTLNFDEQGNIDFSRFVSIGRGGTRFETAINRVFRNGFLTREIEDDGDDSLPTTRVYQYDDFGRLFSIVHEKRSGGKLLRGVSRFNYDCHK